jgi:uncharacterized protein YciI
MRSWLLLALLAVLASPVQALAQLPAPPSSQLFLFLFSPGPAWRAGVPMRQQDLREHGRYHAELVRSGRSVAGGGYVDMDGGLAIVRASSIEEARTMLAADPAIQNGVFVAELRQWQPRFDSGEPLGARPR